MNRRTAKRGLRILVALLALLGVLALAVMVRLAQGPIPLDTLRPAIEGALVPEDGSFEVRVEHTALEWREGPRVLAQGLQVLAPGGRVLGRFPEIALALSQKSLFVGRVSVVRLELDRPVFRIVRGRDGQLGFGHDRGEAPRDPEESPIIGLLAILLEPADPTTPLGALRRIAIRGADLEIEDQLLGVTWRAPDTDLDLARSGLGMRGNATLELDLAGRRSRVDLELDHDRETRTATITLRLSDFDPELVSLAFPEIGLDDHVSVGLPLSGSLGIRMEVAEGLAAVDATEAHFDLTSAPGSLHLKALGLAPLPVDGLRLAGRVHSDLTHFELYEAWLDFAGSRLSLAAWARPAEEAVAVHVTADVRDFDVVRLGEVWPPDAARDARDWVVPNIPQGRIAKGDLELSLRLVDGDPARVEIEELAGTLDARDLLVHYFRPLPAATRVSSAIRFDHDRWDFALRGGRLLDVEIVGGDVAITGTSVEDQDIVIAGRVRGPLTTVLRLLDHEPLALLEGPALRPLGHPGRGRRAAAPGLPAQEGPGAAGDRDRNPGPAPCGGARGRPAGPPHHQRRAPGAGQRRTHAGGGNAGSRRRSGPLLLARGVYRRRGGDADRCPSRRRPGGAAHSRHAGAGPDRGARPGRLETDLLDDGQDAFDAIGDGHDVLAREGDERSYARMIIERRELLGPIAQVREAIRKAAPIGILGPP